MDRIISKLLFVSLLFLLGCSASEPRVKNLIFFIGDGMGPQQIGLLIDYANLAPNSIYKNQPFHLDSFLKEAELGIVHTEPFDGLVIDSPASASQYATGIYSRPGCIGLDSEGRPVPNIMERSKQKGRAIGIVTNTRVTDATPAAFVSHFPERTMEDQVAESILQLEPEVVLGGGMRHFKNILKNAEQKGYQILTTRQELAQSQERKILGLFSESGMPDGIETSLNQKDPNWKTPTLKEMAQKALEVLSKNKKGFVLMLEAGQIDGASHANDAGTLLHEMIHFDETLGFLHHWVKEHPDTLLVVTSDHATGSFAFSHSRNNIPKHPLQPQYNFGDPNVLDKIYNQKKSFFSMTLHFAKTPQEKQTPKELQKLLNQNLSFEITEEEAKNILAKEKNEYFKEGHPYLAIPMYPKFHDFKEFYPYGNLSVSGLIGRAIAKEQQVTWGTGAHTDTPVYLMSYGPKKGTNLFRGLLHSTEVGQRMQSVLLLDSPHARR